jgi:hypothetical protein
LARKSRLAIGSNQRASIAASPQKPFLKQVPEAGFGMKSFLLYDFILAITAPAATLCLPEPVRQYRHGAGSGFVVDFHYSLWHYAHQNNSYWLN